MRRLLVLIMCGAAALAETAVPESAARAARAWRTANERPILDEFSRLLAIPNVARNLDDMARNAALITELYAKRGVAIRRLEVPGSPPALFGEMPVAGATRTVVFYAHYDGQPVVPRQWTGGEPFRPELRDRQGNAVNLAGAARFDPEWRLYARSASDDKAPVLAFLAAIDALRAANLTPSANLKFFFDGEEEAGSPHLPAILTKYKDLLAGDVWLFCDGPVHQSRKPQVVFGARGSTGLEVTVYGPHHELHSGHYGNWAPNPAMMLAQLLASMKDEDGKVRVSGFYDDVVPLTDADRQALAALPPMDAALKEEFWLGSTEVPSKRLEEMITLPALNVQGFASGGVGPEARNVIPATATVSLGIRLVKGMDPRKTVNQVIEHIRRQGYHVVESETEPGAATRKQYPKVCRIRRRDGGDRAVRVPMDSPVARRVIAAVESARGSVYRLPTAGGTLPLAPFEDVLGAPVMIVPIVNHDNNQHSHNENIRLQNLWDGVETMAALMAMQ